MAIVRNVPLTPVDLDSLIQATPHQISSKKILEGEDCQISIFAFGEDEGISSESYSGDSLYVGLSGVCYITHSNSVHKLLPGQTMMIREDVDHAISGEGRYKIMQIITR